MRSPGADVDGDSLGLDIAAVSSWIRSVGVETLGNLRYERIGMGQSNLTIDVRDEGDGRWVLRRPPLGHLLSSAHDVMREATILAGLVGTDVPVPKVLGICRDERVSSAPLLLMSFVEGLVLDRMETVEGLSPTIRQGVSRSMVEALAAIHAVDLEATGLTGLASHEPYAPRQLKRWSSQWENTKTRERPALDELTGRLRGSVPAQHETTLVHGDFHVRNLICSPGTGDIRAVLDWELCTLGDPLADIGSMLAYWPEAGDPQPSPLFAGPTLPGFMHRAELAEAYLATTGRDEATLRFWHVLGLWKIAIICEGVMRRSQADARNGSDDDPMDPAIVDYMIDRAFSVASDRTAGSWVDPWPTEKERIPMTDAPSMGDVLKDSPKNWGKWGPHDEVGSLNYLTSSEVLRGAASIRSGEVFTLQVQMGRRQAPGDPVWPGRGPMERKNIMDEGFFERGEGKLGPGGAHFADDIATMYLQGSTQYDALGHVWYDGQLWNGYDATTTVDGMSKASVLPIAERGVVGRGVLLDMARFRGKRHLDKGETFDHEDLLACARLQGVTLQKRDILVIRTGFVGWWYETTPEEFYADFVEPGLTFSPALVQWFHDMEIPNLVTDTLANEVSIDPVSGVSLPLHNALMRNLGVAFTEIAWLEDLASACATDRRWTFLYTAAPLKVVEGSGAPVNPIAIR